eukprot:CAMPEP_0196133054 /NCGR_PEP_ID=MMETSP0910-20130528/2434_1 /TAXON_ID=49265 /ORGANISM="Thalassiosira rotula, Strain GSO102" /LENGTH=940 /DNA_ID=CAMNT_0041392735 /DNA_START=39 /DNA_END=2861 /DNA_ORIENTATION=+
MTVVLRPFALLALAVIKYSSANAAVDQYEPHIYLEREFGHDDTDNPTQRRKMASENFKNGLSLYYPVWKDGGYCDNDPSGSPELEPNNQVKLYDTLEECCQSTFSWMSDNTCLLNSQATQSTDTSIPEEMRDIDVAPTVSAITTVSTVVSPDQVGGKDAISTAPSVSENATVSVAPPPGSVISKDGNEGCPCTDASDILRSFPDRSCRLPDGQDGIMLNAEALCVPYTYGSTVCNHHDLIYDPKCDTSKELGEDDIPAYCIRSFCYVDAVTCRQSSEERVFRTDRFPRDDNVDLFYSYSTCGSTDEDWIQNLNESELSGKTILAIVPEYSSPIMYKRDRTGKILSKPGPEYYDSSVKYEGAIIEYLNELKRISKGKLNIEYTFGSGAGKKMHSESKYTAAVQDIADGLADMAVGGFWITGQRLELTTFTVPLYDDRTVLVIPRPGNTSSLPKQTSKVLEPFELGVWGLIILLIAVTALLSVWFTTSGQKFRQIKKRERVKKGAYARLALDEFLDKGMFFCSAGVSPDTNTSSLPQNFLMFGFAFFILIVVSAYVANLAAFLTRPAEFVGTIEAVNEVGLQVCGHAALEKELTTAWPTVSFMFNKGGYDVMLENYKNGECQVLAVGKTDVEFDTELTKKFCEAGLVLTDSLIVEIPVAFPIRPGLGKGLSYWMHSAKNDNGLNFLDELEKLNAPICDLEFKVEDQEADDYTPITPGNLFFPFMVFLGCALLAVVLQLWHQRALKKGSNARTLIGRRSSMVRATVSNSNRRGYGLNDSKSDESDRGLNDSESYYPKALSPPSRAMSKSGLSKASNRIEVDEFYDNNNRNQQTEMMRSVGFSDDYGDTPLHSDKIDDVQGDTEANLAIGNSGDNCAVTLNSDHNNDVQGNSDDGSAAKLSSGKDIDAASRLHLLVETGAFDEILDCFQDIKRQKESSIADSNI